MKMMSMARLGGGPTTQWFLDGIFQHLMSRVQCEVQLKCGGCITKVRGKTWASLQIVEIDGLEMEKAGDGPMALEC